MLDLFSIWCDTIAHSGVLLFIWPETDLPQIRTWRSRRPTPQRLKNGCSELQTAFAAISKAHCLSFQNSATPRTQTPRITIARQHQSLRFHNLREYIKFARALRALLTFREKKFRIFSKRGVLAVHNEIALLSQARARSNNADDTTTQNAEMMILVCRAMPSPRTCDCRWVGQEYKQSKLRLCNDSDYAR